MFITLSQSQVLINSNWQHRKVAELGWLKIWLSDHLELVCTLPQVPTSTPTLWVKEAQLRKGEVGESPAHKDWERGDSTPLHCRTLYSRLQRNMQKIISNRRLVSLLCNMLWGLFLFHFFVFQHTK